MSEENHGKHGPPSGHETSGGNTGACRRPPDFIPKDLSRQPRIVEGNPRRQALFLLRRAVRSIPTDPGVRLVPTLRVGTHWMAAPRPRKPVTELTLRQQFSTSETITVA